MGQKPVRQQCGAQHQSVCVARGAAVAVQAVAAVDAAAGVGACANVYEFGRFEIADGFGNVLQVLPIALIS